MLLLLSFIFVHFTVVWMCNNSDSISYDHYHRRNNNNNVINDFQIVLNNSRALGKGQLYSFLESLLGEGLLTASGIYIVMSIPYCIR